MGYLLNEEVTDFLQENNNPSRSAVEATVNPGEADAVHQRGNDWNTLVKLHLQSSSSLSELSQYGVLLHGHLVVAMVNQLVAMVN